MKRNRLFVCFNSFDLLREFIEISEDVIFKDEEALKRYVEKFTTDRYVILSENDVAHEIYVNKDNVHTKLGKNYIVYPVYIS
ncbi:MAG: hypothetical protein E6X47_02870 [Haemophilus parainfluenzae]|nr:hypothetical protein [Haemophilus parainfluenzae]